MVRQWSLRTGICLFAVLLAIYGGTYLLWATGHQDAYLAVVRFWGIDAWHWPFLDLDTVISWGDCRQRGYDVFRANPCTQFGGTVSYGPILAYLPFHRSQSQLLGIVAGIAFLATAIAVLRPKRREEWIAATLALLSTATLFALERSNLDLVEFLMIAVSGVLIGKGQSGRVGTYALYYAGGTLKFYPFVLFLQVLRERPRRAVIACLASGVAIAAFAWMIRTEMGLIKKALPTFDYNSDAFGVLLLPFGLASEMNLGDTAGRWMLAGMLIAAVLAALLLTRRLLRARLKWNWYGRDGYYLTAGAMVMTGCFLLQTNLDYRAIFFLFMLPGLFALARSSRDRSLQRIFCSSAWVIIFCMWGEFLRRLLDRIPSDVYLPRLVFFLGRELAWWFVIVVGTASVMAFLLRTPPVRLLLRRA